MKLTLVQILGLIAAGGLAVEASGALNHYAAHSSQHHRLSRQLDNPLAKRATNSRCSARAAPSISVSTHSSSSTSVAHTSVSHSSPAAKASPSAAKASPKASPKPSAAPPSAPYIAAGLIDVTGQCGSNGATSAYISVVTLQFRSHGSCCVQRKSLLPADLMVTLTG